MEEKLNKLYLECCLELESIGIDIKNDKDIGTIDIKIAKRNSKRYGCCKQEKPDKRYFHYIKKGYRKYKVYDKFEVHHIEICKWVMDLDDKIIKNTIMHEIIHCFPNCNNHKSEFKKYSTFINEKLGYNISRVGNKKEDYEKSKIEFIGNEENWKYKIVCNECNQTFYRKRLNKNFLKKYRCGICKGKFKIYINQ